MMRVRLRPDKRSVALLGAGLCAILAGGGALLYQQQRSLATITLQLRDKERQRDESARLASRLAELELRFKEDQDQLKFLESSLPSMAYVPTLLKQIEKLGKDTKNVVRGVRPEMAPRAPVRPAVRRTDPEAQEGGDGPKEEKPKPPEPYDRLTIQVALTGSYQDYQLFLQKLTHFPKIVAVDRVQLRPRHDNSNPGGNPRLDVDMQLTAFILKEGALAHPALPAPTGTQPPAASAAQEASMPGPGGMEHPSPFPAEDAGWVPGRKSGSRPATLFDPSAVS
jgi:Tfp pilus assembly protein PilO